MQFLLIFLTGMIIGSVAGIFVMCLCEISGKESRREETLSAKTNEKI